MEFSKRLVGSGKWKGHLDYEPAIWPLGNGERCNLVAKVVLRDDITDGGHWCQGIITGQRFRLVADLPKEIGCPKVTILNGAKTYYRWPMLVIDKKAELLIHAPDDQSRMTELIETCSGIEVSHVVQHMQAGPYTHKTILILVLSTSSSNQAMFQS